MRMIVACFVIAACASTASAQFNWSDGFEGYNLGSLCSAPACANAGASGGWGGWDGNDAAAGTVVDSTTAVPSVAAHTGSRFMQIGATTDAIQPFSLNYPGTYPTSGLWEISAWCYIPTGGLTASTYFIVNNVYNYVSPQNWAVQLQFMPSGIVNDDQRGGSVPVVFDQWVQIRVLVDLNTNTTVIRYNNQIISSGMWTVAAGAAAIANIDLYSGGTAFYDDLSVLPAAPQYETNSAEAALAFNGVQGGAFSPAKTSVGFGMPITASLSSTLVGNLYDVAVVSAPVQPSVFTTPNLQVVNLPYWDPSLWFLNSLSPIPNLLPFPGNFNLTIAAPSMAMTLSAQMFVVDPLHPDGLVISQAAELDVIPCANPENFDSATNGNTVIPGLPGTYPPCWTDGGGTYMWKVYSGLTPSASTGPDFDHTTGTTNGKYMYCETSGGSSGATFILNAPPNAVTTGSVSFWYHMYGATTGTLALQENQAGTWTTIWSLAGNQGNTWLQAVVPVTTNPVSVRFHYTRGTSFTGDTAIDDVQIN